jgi:Protein of function (DUF2518)
MPSTSDFLTYTQWSALLGVFFAVATGVSFLFKWGFRFRLVGATGFMIVLTVGLFALSLVPITRARIPGAARFTTVYDSGSNLATIVVSPTITEEQLAATLQQASSDLFSPGRLGRGKEEMIIRARTIVHVKEGLSQPLYLGEARRSIGDGRDVPLDVKIYHENLAKAAQAS